MSNPSPSKGIIFTKPQPPEPSPSPSPSPSEQPSPSPSPNEAAGPSGPSPDPAAHLDDLIAERSSEAEVEAETVALGIDQAQRAGFVTVEQFHSTFCNSFALAHAITQLQSLAIVPGDPVTREATAAIYDSIADVPALHFLLRPGGKWAQRAMAIGTFAVPIGLGVSVELQARRAAPKGKPEPEAGNDNTVAANDNQGGENVVQFSAEGADMLRTP
jgi:hypothetical protein